MVSLKLQRRLAASALQREGACNLCKIEFANENDQKNHYKSGWHYYNLECKIAGRPGATEALFLTRQATLAKEKNKLIAPSKLCGLCGKGFGSSMAHAQHLNSQSHIMRQMTLAKENNKLNAPSKVYACGLCGKWFGSSEACAQHINSQSHITQMIQDGHRNESTPIVKTLAPHIVNKLSQNEDAFDEWEVVDRSDEWEEVDVSAMNARAEEDDE